MGSCSTSAAYPDEYQTVIKAWFAPARRPAQTFVSKVELGERRLDVTEFLRIAEAIGIDPLRLLGELQDRWRGQLGQGAERNKAWSQEGKRLHPLLRHFDEGLKEEVLINLADARLAASFI